MLMSRIEWYVSSAILLSAFGIELVLALSSGPDNVVSFIVGAAFTFVLVKWAQTQRERRRGWKVIAHEDGDSIAVGILARVPADDRGDA